jgi:hypothetical protein
MCLTFHRGDDKESPQPIQMPQIAAKDDPGLASHNLPGTCELFKTLAFSVELDATIDSLF